MIKNYLKIAWRNIIRKKSFSFINITGLSIGMSAAVLIVLWIASETSIDRHHKNVNRIYQVFNTYTIDGKVSSWNTTPKVMAKAIQKDLPEVEHVTRANWPYPMLLIVGEKSLKATSTIVDSMFLKIFTFPMIKGDPAKVLMDPHSIVVTQSLAKKLFGDEDPMGKIIKLDNKLNFTVTGIMKDLEKNTSFTFEFLLPWAYLREDGRDDEYWGNNSTSTYVLLKENATLASAAPKLKNLRSRYAKDPDDQKIVNFLYPVSRLYLHGRFENGVETGGRITYVRLFGVIAGLILLIACINFMNLSTARSEKRAKEVGIRKVVGAQKKSLIMQFLGESVLYSLLAGILALVIVALVLPSFNTLVGKKLSLDFSDVNFWLAAVAFIFLTGILAGSYPAIYLSSFKPVKVLKGTFKAVNALVTPRKILVVGQFTFAIVLIISTIIVRQQLQKAQNREIGYSKNNLIYTFLEGDMEKNYMSIKNELLNSGLAYSVTKSSAPMTEGWSNTWGMQWTGKDPSDKTIIDRYHADDDIVKTTGLQLVAGRDIDLDKYPTDSFAIILNQAAVKHMKFTDPLGQIVNDNNKDYHVVGVVKDFILTNPYNPIIPLAIEGASGWFSVIHIKFNSNIETAAALKRTEAIMKKYNPAYPFNYTFVDESYAAKFSNEKRTSKLASIFAMLAIVISCLGLFGLSSYMAENRIKEIGVRKVLGASVVNITRLLSKDFLKLVLISFVIAAPLAYWAMHSWLQDYEYRVSIQWWVFAVAGFSAILIALVTVSFQAIKAAMANPVKSLRSE